ncbi:MAG: hypothetical protein AWU57_208 [Marinobacter sp. T13-3]|nr:MAG: hypothetical protein AWU57_208 [Marinobacter sp. T13-3]
MSRKKSTFKQRRALLQNGVYKKNGRGKAPQKAIWKANAKASSEAGKAIKQSQKESQIRDLMKKEGITYAQAAIALMD